MVLDTSEQLVEQWVAAWVHVRDLTVTRCDGWPLVRVAAPSRETEIVCVDPGVARWHELTRHVAGDSRAMLTVMAHDVGPYLTARRRDDVRIDRDDESLMSATLEDVPVPALPDGLTSRWDLDEHRTTYTLESGDAVAATGTVGLLGRVAVFDEVETMPAFQRRGLGSHVVAVLTTQAHGRGATHGVLAASAQGRPLYQSFGWRTRLEMLSVMGT
jgi:GNAT superfamily N-acetyltransferase